MVKERAIGVPIKRQEPELVETGLKVPELKALRDKVASLGKCCEGGSEGWTG